MTSKFVTFLCYRDGKIYDGKEGITYDKSPSKAIKVQRGIKFNDLVNQIYFATSIDKQQYHIKVICRYPSVVGKVMKYIPLPIKDDNDVEIMFDVLSLHQELSNIDLYLEIDVNGNKNHMDITPRTQESDLIEKEMNTILLPTMNPIDVVSDMIHNEDFNIISEFAVVNNGMNSGFDTDNDGYESGDENETENRGDLTTDGAEIPSNFTSLEGIDVANVDNWTVSHSESKNHLTEELGENSFKNKDELIRAIKLYTIRKHRQYEVVETCPTIWKIRCKLCSQTGCKWQLRACKRKRSEYFEITQYIGPHTCSQYKITQDHPNLDASLIAQETEHLIKEQPSISIPTLRAEIIDKLGYTPSYRKVWVGKQKAIEHIFGNWEESYIVLPKFMAALQFYNPETIVEWCTARLSNVDHIDSNMNQRESSVDQVEFRRVFWVFAPSINGFAHCRPVVSIDATHLYGKYKGKMMIAMGVDGNNQIFPLAFAIVENESYNSWYWFLNHVKKHVVKERGGICLISDRHSGILKVVNEQGSPWLEPHSFHMYCLRHFVNNFHDKFRNSHLKVLAYRAGSQNQVRKFNSIMDEIGKLNAQARQWLEGHSLCRWTLAHDGGKRYGLLTTNMSEIFNNVLKGARFLPITPCVKLTFYRLVHYFDVRRSLGPTAQANGDVFTPHVVVKQAASMSKASAHTLKSFNRQKGIIEVVTQKGKNMQVVDLEKKTCTCGKWEIYKYPCSHVLSACAYLSLNTSQYIQRYYSIFEYSATWASDFSPIPHEAYWPETSIQGMLPNSELKRKEKGRPRSTRLRNGMDIKEGKKANLCGLCRLSGHNQKTCPSKPRKRPMDM
uniref:SWIM-type domain-containing protein n=1 Tax=Lactuca sativa TaxID=4236 RepID=A0A9R1XA62_LACSA|nr:hypothetical protein LSAT_V11C500279080 [Lactuca sativa]